MEHVQDWLAAVSPDVVALQETKIQDHDFPIEAIEASGYQCVYAGQKSYNGVAILSKRPAKLLIDHIPGFDDPQRRVLGVQFDEFVMLNLYAPNGSSVDSDKYHYKLEWLAALKDYVAKLTERHDALVLLGDFNIAPADADVHDPKAWRGKVLVSEAERKALMALTSLGLTDAFRLFEKRGDGYSWWDYRAGGFRRNLGVRIDLILLSAVLSSKCIGCDVDQTPRRREKPSDHAPVVAEFEFGHSS